MAKNKSKKTGLSEKIQNKRKNGGNNSTKSPFEIHINKQKLKVLGRKTKHDKGFPGLARSKAIDKRKKTLLEELHVCNKTNVFKDRRIAENDPTLSYEEKQMARFAAIRQKAHKKKSIFNLGDDENSAFADEEDILTHKGQALSEIEKFEDPRSDDENDIEDDGRLGKNFVSQLHFGGGFLTKPDQKGHKDVLEEMIAESKKRKAENKQTKDEVNELTEKLDTDWKDLIPLVSDKMGKPKEKVASTDEFTRMKNKINLEARVIASDPVKTEEEIAKKEEERLEALEKERLERMNAIEEDDSEKYENPDDLNGNLVYESFSEGENEDEEKDQECTNSYEEKDEECSNSDEESGDEEKSVDIEDEQDQKLHEEENDSDISDEQEDDDDSEDDLSDLKAETSESEEEELIEKETKNLHTPADQGELIEKIIKGYNATKSEGNKDKLTELFKHILQHINDMASEARDETALKSAFSILKVLPPHLFDLAQIVKVSSADAVREVIKDKFEEYIKKPKSYPGLEVLFFLKTVSLLFPTSDFRHGVVTPCFLFMEKMLISCQVKTRRHISYGLFLSALVLEYTTLSKRFMPGCINFLGGILHMAIPKTLRVLKVVPPFKSKSSDLVLCQDCSSMDCSLKMEAEDLVNTEITESFKVKAVYSAVSLAIEFFNNFKEYPSNLEIFETIYQYCERINLEMYPKDVRKGIESFIGAYEDCRKNRKLEFVREEAQKPKLLKMYEPKVFEVYDRKQHKVQSKEKAERSKLLHKLKREKKGALREIRRDNAFLSRVKITKQIEDNMESRQKVKRIFAEANIQQSELNALDRKKRKMK